MENLNNEEKNIDFNNCSLAELKKLLKETNDKEVEVKKELDYILNKLNEE